MATATTNLTVGSYEKRSQEIRDIEAACTRAEQGGKIDLNPATKKLSELGKQLNEDKEAIHRGTTVSWDVRRAHDHHSKDLTSLNARITALSSKANPLSAWVKPACYTAALAIAAIGVMTLIGNSTSSSQPTPPPTARPTSPPTFKPTFIPSRMPTPSLPPKQNHTPPAKTGNSTNADQLKSCWANEIFSSAGKEKPFIAPTLALTSTPIFEPTSVSAPLSPSNQLPTPPPTLEPTSISHPTTIESPAPKLTLYTLLTQLAMLGDEYSMLCLEDGWGEGQFDSTNASSIRDAYNSAPRELAMRGDWKSMGQLERHWRDGRQNASDADKSIVRNAYDKARKGMNYVGCEKWARLGDKICMYHLKSSWSNRCGYHQIHSSEEDKSAIRDEYNWALKQALEKDIEKAKMGDKEAMNKIEIEKTIFSEQEISAIRNAYNLAVKQKK